MGEHDKLLEDVPAASSPGRDLFMRSLREVLARKGYMGDALEERVRVVLARDPSRIAAVFSERVRNPK